MNKMLVEQKSLQESHMLDMTTLPLGLYDSNVTEKLIMMLKFKIKVKNLSMHGKTSPN